MTASNHCLVYCLRLKQEVPESTSPLRSDSSGNMLRHGIRTELQAPLIAGSCGRFPSCQSCACLSAKHVHSVQKRYYFPFAIFTLQAMKTNQLYLIDCLGVCVIVRAISLFTWLWQTFDSSSKSKLYIDTRQISMLNSQNHSQQVCRRSYFMHSLHVTR